MGQPIKWVISFGMFLILGGIGLYTPWLNSSLEKTQENLLDLSQQALAEADQAEWAQLSIDGQKVILSGTAPNNIARAEAIAAIASATGSKGPLYGGISTVDASGVFFSGSNRVQNDIDLPVVSPFRFQADYQGNFIRFDHQVTSEQFQNRLKTIAAEDFSEQELFFDETKIAAGAPGDAWETAIMTTLKTLSSLERGFLFVEDETIKLSGASTDPDAELVVNETLGLLPEGYTATVDLMIDGKPVNFIYEGTADYAPAPEDDDALQLTPPASPNNQDDEPRFKDQTSYDGILEEEVPPSTKSVPSSPTRKPVRVPAPGKLKRDTSTRLPPAPEPRDIYKDKTPAVETSPLPIQPPTKNRQTKDSQAAAIPVSAPSRKGDATSFAETQNATFTNNAELRAGKVAPQSHQSQTRLDTGPAGYLPPPNRQESITDRLKRQCQNEITMMLSYKEISFLPASAVITTQTRPLLAALADTAQRCSMFAIKISGHTDATGIEDENLILSRERAETVAAFFSDRGIDPARLKVTGFGSTAPIADNSSVVGQRKNRRVEITFTD